MADSPQDAALVHAAVGGDRQAFAAIYDRYADRIHDFCIGMLRDRDAAADCTQDTFVVAAQKLPQLREQERLRSWLYAIARNECMARLRGWQREHSSEDLPDMPSDDADLATLAARTELAELIEAASGGLSDRDRAVLELAYRQDLDGSELADALGVTARNANTLVERMRETVSRSLGALLVCRRIKADPARCAELAEILADWDGHMTVLLRKRAARHIDGCATCGAEQKRLVTPGALLGSTPIVIPAPAWLRENTLDGIEWPPPAGSGESWWPEDDFDTGDLRRGMSRRVARGAAAIALVTIGLGGAVLLGQPGNVGVVPTDRTEPMNVTTTTPSVAPSLPTTTPPTAVPRSAPPPVSTTVVVPSSPSTTAVATTSADAPAPRIRTTTTEESVSRTQPTTRTSVPQPERDPVEDEPVEEPEEPSPSTQPDKPAVPTIERPTPGQVSPIETCTPMNPCDDGPPVFS